MSNPTLLSKTGEPRNFFCIKDDCGCISLNIVSRALGRQFRNFMTRMVGPDMINQRRLLRALRGPSKCRRWECRRRRRLLLRRRDGDAASSSPPTKPALLPAMTFQTQL